MARNRKSKAKTPITDYNPPDTLEIPDDEKWRLIDQSGILRKGVPHSTKDQAEGEEDIPLAEEIFNAVLLIIPFSFLLLTMEILIHHQYGKRATLQVLVDRMAPGVPIMSIFIFYTTRHKRHRRTQFFLFVLSLLVGPRMIWLISRGSWLVNMRQCPPLATIWVYTIVQLDLGPAVLNLLITMSWAWWKRLKPFR